jgi:urease accessory protein
MGSTRWCPSSSGRRCSTAEGGQITRPQLHLAFARIGDRTVFERRFFEWPFVLTRTFQLDEHPSHLLTVIVQSGAGGIHGADRLTQRIRVGRGAAVSVTTQGATSVLRADAGQISMDTATICVEDDGFIEYLPEARVLFPDSAIDQSLRVECAAGGRAIVSDAFTWHDPSGRDRDFRELRSNLTVSVGGHLGLVDRLDVRTIGRWMQARWSSFGTAVVVTGLDPERSARFASELTYTLARIDGVYGAASPLPGDLGVGVRLASPELRGVQLGIRTARAAFRRLLFGGPPSNRLDAIKLGSERPAELSLPVRSAP